MALSLGVNIDHIATVRQARGGKVPDVIKAAQEAERAGADGITVHLREDRRHIQDSDVYGLKRVLGKKFNLEMAIHARIIAIALDVRPDQVTLVPEKRRELTTEGGLNLVKEWRRVEPVVARLQKRGIHVSLFIDADSAQIRRAAQIGAHVIELHTGEFAHFFHSKRRMPLLRKLCHAAEIAGSMALTVHAGHGLDYENVSYMNQMPFVHELNIGHAIVAQALFIGMYRAVRAMKAAMKKNV